MNKNFSSHISARHTVSKEQLIKDLRKMGLKKGDHLAVTLSFKSIGYVVGGPEAFIDALLDTVGSEGTIMMNAFTQSFWVHNIPSDYIFDIAKTMPYTGIVPQTLIKREDSIRSWHPTLSVVSIGKMAKYLTECHNENSKPFLPYEKLAKIGGKYLAIGIGNRLVGIRHEAQRRAGLFVVPIFQGAYFRNSLGQIKLFIHLGVPCIKELQVLVPKLESTGVIKRGKIGMASSIIGSADKLINLMTYMLKENPTLNLCDDWYCYKCRELERRLGLYERIVNPKLFQRNRFIRTVLSWRNNLFIRMMNYQDSRKLPNWLMPISRVFAFFRQFIFKLLS